MNLLLKSIDKAGLSIPVEGAEVFVGRDSECGICFDHKHLSRIHARLYRQKNQIFLEDLDSTNGTFVNNKRLESPEPVKPGDVIKFAFATFCLMSQEDLNATVMMARLPKDASQDEDSSIDLGEITGSETILRESFPLPAQWNRYQDDANFSKQKYPLEIVKQMVIAKFGKSDIVAALVVTAGNYERKIYPMKKDWTQLLIGRGDKCQIKLPDVCISGQHCHINQEEGAWYLEDLGASNGVYINEKRIENSKLNDGDRVRLGVVEMCFCLL